MTTTTTKRTCLACETPLTGDASSQEHVLPQWLAGEIDMSTHGVSLKHYLHDDREPADALLRSHGLSSFSVRKICEPCNNGWMSRLENQAKPHILDLMSQKMSLLSLDDDVRTILSRWAVKTAFMIAAVQTIQFDLQWAIFRRLKTQETEGPAGCIVFASQQAQLPKGFLYTCPSDELPVGKPIQLRVGFSIHHLCFVVVIPIVGGPRVLTTLAPIHILLWPLDGGVTTFYRKAPQNVSAPNQFLDYLADIVKVTIIDIHEAVQLDDGSGGPAYGGKIQWVVSQK